MIIAYFPLELIIFEILTLKVLDLGQKVTEHNIKKVDTFVVRHIVAYGMNRESIYKDAIWTQI